MTYNFIKAKNPNNIKEQQFATANEIKFSTFTSCVGVIAKKGDLLTGVHLVKFGVDVYLQNAINPPTEAFSANTAAYITTVLLPQNPDAIAIVGFIKEWESTNDMISTADIRAGIQKLTGECKQLKKYQTHNTHGDYYSSVYGAKIVNGEIVIAFEGFE